MQMSLKTTAAFARIKAFPLVSSFLIFLFSSNVTLLRIEFIIKTVKVTFNNLIISDRFRYILYIIISESLLQSVTQIYASNKYRRNINVNEIIR